MLAVAGAVGTYAADYVYTATAKYKLTGENLISNGNFTTTDGWTNEDGEALSSVVWQLDAEKPEGLTGNSMMSLTATGDPDNSEAKVKLCAVWQVETAGLYVYSYWIKAAEGSLTAGITADAANSLMFYKNSTGANEGTQVAETFNFSNEWMQVVDTVQMDDNSYLVFNANALATGTKVTGFELRAAEEVYDTRILDREIAWAQSLLNDEDLSAAATPAAKDEVTGLIVAIGEEASSGNLDDVEYGGSMLTDLQVAVDGYLNSATIDLGTEEYFKYVTDLTKMGKYNRKDIKHLAQIGGFVFEQDGASQGGETNWVHGKESEFLSKWILKGNDNGPGSVYLYNKSFPAGKYFISAEVQTGTAGRGSNDWSTVFDIESNVVPFVGTDSAAAVTFSGPYYTKVYGICELKEGEELKAGFWWASRDRSEIGNATPEFMIKNFSIRGFGDLSAKIEHNTAWNAFLAQYNAATTAREKVVEAQANAKLPWGKDSLTNALTQWDPYYNAVESWINADGSDAGVATTEQLNEWAKYQGVELYNAPAEEGAEPTRVEYAVVRGYQNAYNYVVALNKVFADMESEIANAEVIRDDDINAAGDKTTFQAAIDAASSLLSTTLTTTTDATMQADSVTMATGIETLIAAEEAFKNSVPDLTPFIDIDFSTPFTTVEGGESGTLPAIEGAKGTMVFAEAARTQSCPWELGYTTTSSDGLIQTTELGDVLRVGKGEATVDITETIADNEILRVDFDLWCGNLVNRYMGFELRNAAGARIGGFKFSKYSNVVEYNDFNNAENTGLDVLKYVTAIGSGSQSNLAICVDNNKSSFSLIIDYKAQALKGRVENGKNGICQGEYTAIAATDDAKVAKIAFTSTYDNTDRRSWLDNLKVYKYASTAEGPIDLGVKSIEPAQTVVKAGVYTLTGVKVADSLENLKSGLYIFNGKKFFVK